jgi:hypothetical protein
MSDCAGDNTGAQCRTGQQIGDQSHATKKTDQGEEIDFGGFHDFLWRAANRELPYKFKYPKLTDVGQ